MRDIEDLHIIGGSMEPVISKNETVFLEKGCLDVVPGDIISYQTGCKTKIVAHRLIRKQKIGTRLYFLQCPEGLKKVFRFCSLFVYQPIERESLEIFLKQ